MKKTADYVTRQDLREELVEFKKEFKKELKTELKTELREDLGEDIRKFRDEIMTGIDGVMKELEAMREDSTIGTYQIRNLREEADDHEKRITRLESTQKLV